jgi:hypothetical protein
VEPDERNGSYRNVYCLRSFQPVEIPYEEIWALPGFNAGDVFMGLRILSDERADVVMQAFGITTATAAQQESVLEKAVADRLAHLLGTVVPTESVDTSQTSYQQAEEARLVRRNESQLLEAYRKASASLQGPRSESIRAGRTSMSSAKTRRSCWRPRAGPTTYTPVRPLHSCWITGGSPGSR